VTHDRGKNLQNNSRRKAKSMCDTDLMNCVEI